MSKALVLITLKLEYISNIEELEDVPGVTGAEPIYEPYDVYAFIESDTSEEMRHRF